MVWQSNPFAVPVFVGAVAMSVLTLVTWRFKTQQSAQFFIAFMVSVTGLMITYGLELLAANLPLIVTCLKLEYVFELSVPVLFLLFILTYTGYDAWLTRPRIAALFAIPALQLVAVWTNEYHSLNWRTVTLQLIGSDLIAVRTYGPAFWIGTSYLYLVAFAAFAVLILNVVRSSRLQRGQLFPLIVSMIIILICNIVTILGASLISHLDLTPFGYAIICVLIAWSLLRHKLFEIMPAAYQAVIEGMSDSVIVIDAQRRVIELNPAAERLTGQNGANIIGQPAADALGEITKVMTCCHGDQEAQHELSMTINGAAQHFDQRISPLFDKHGKLTGYIIVLREITRLKQAEEAARRYAAELEERNQELDAFSHTVAHDLKAPLTLVSGYAEIILTREVEGLTARSKKHIEAIGSAAAKMTDMVNELLSLAKTRDVDSVVTDIDASSIARSATERFRNDIDRRGLEIEIVPDLPHALGNAVWVEEVFANLISNAIKYMGKDNLTPRIIVKGALCDGSVRYEIQDNGLGIDLKDQARLFSAFARFHKNEASGVGLGLTIVLRIVKRLNGQVGVESTPGKGSTFWFTLPTLGQPISVRGPVTSDNAQRLSPTVVVTGPAVPSKA